MKAMRAAIVPTLLGIAFTAVAEHEHERRFVWQEATTRAGAARTPAEFAGTATAYEALQDLGVRNGILFYNLGTVLLMAESYEEAAAALLRAERYLGSTPDVRRNLRLALAAGAEGELPALPWYRVPLFWHYGLPGATRMALTAWSFLAVWIGLLMRRVRRDGPARAIIVLAVAVCVLFGSSVAATLYQEARAAAAGRTVVEALRPTGAGAQSGRAAHEAAPGDPP